MPKLHEYALIPREQACAHCGSPFMARGRGQYCSASCRGKAKYLRQKRAVTKLIPDDETVVGDGTTGTTVGWGVTVGGYRHGGRHYSIGDALAHLDRCRHWSDADRKAWTEMNEAHGGKKS